MSKKIRGREVVEDGDYVTFYMPSKSMAFADDWLVVSNRPQKPILGRILWNYELKEYCYHPYRGATTQDELKEILEFVVKIN